MNNFQVAIDATATAMDSAGSAMKENASYMESLEAQTTQLKATFQDFANNVIDKELVSSILTLANDALGALNTEAGKTITQWGLLTGVLTGGLTIYGQIASKLIGAAKSGLTFASAITGAGTAASGAAIGFGTLASTALPIAAALSGVAIIGWEVLKWIKETHKPLQEYTEEIQSNTEQLEQNRDRLAEIEQMSWDKKTPEILDEYDALVQQNEELQRNIDLLEKRRSNRAKDQARKGGEVATGGTYYTAVGFDDFTQYKDAETAYLSLASANHLVVVSAEDAKQQLEAMGITLQENAEMVEVDADAYNEDLTASMQEYASQLNSTHSLNQDQLRDYESLKITVSERVEGLKLLEAQGVTLTESERNLIDVYDSLIETEAQAKEWTEKYGDALIITDEQAKQLIKTFPALKDQLIDTGSGWAILNANAQSAADGLISADGRIKASSKDRVASTIADIKSQIEAYKQLYEITLYQPYSNTDPDYEEKKRKIGMAKKAYEEAAAALVRLEWAQTQTKKYGYYDDTPKSLTSPTSTTKNKNKNKTTNKNTTTKATDLALEEFKNLQRDLEHQRELDLNSEEEYYDKLEQFVKNYKAKATAHMKEYGTDADTINRNMYQYEEEIYKGRTKLADELKEQQEKAAEEAAKAQKEALEKQKEDFETAVSYVVKQIDKEIDKLQDLRDQTEKQKEDFETAVDYVVRQINKEITKLQDLRGQTEKYYDDKIDAVNKANDALEDQIHYEELLNNLAKAKDKQLYVFQNGQFQYVQDVEAIASAQAELDAYERGEALQKEVENLETLKEQALASIDEQIAGWEKYKEQWESVTTQYQEQQDKMLAEQILGIDTEQENWETRLTNLQSFVDQYNAIDLASIDKQIEGWEKYKEEWEGVTTQYQEQQDKLLAEQLLGVDTEQKNWETRLVNLQSFVDQYNAILSQLNSGTTISSTGNAIGRGEGNFVSGSGAWSGIPHDDTDSDFDRDEVIKNNTSIGKGRDYLAEAIAAADKGLIDKAYALLDERDKKLDAQGRNSAGGVNKEESREIINVHLDAYTTTKHANGTISAPGGLSLVGEKGPELRVLNSGDGIIPADATRNLWNWANYNPKDFMGNMGSDNIFHIGNIALPNVTDAKSFVNGLKQLAYQRAYKRA